MVILHIISCPLTNPYCYCLWEREIICRTSKMWKWVNVNFVCLSAYLASFPDVILNTWVCQVKNAHMDEVLLKYGASIGAIVTGDPGMWREGRSDTVLCTWQWEPLLPSSGLWIRILLPWTQAVSPFDRIPMGSAGFPLKESWSRNQMALIFALILPIICF